MNHFAHLPPGPQPHPASILPIVAAGLVGFGITVLIMSVAYVRDLAMLRQVPETIWLMLCGVPNDNPITLPILLVTGGLALLSGTVVLVVYQLRRKPHNT